MTKKAAMKFCDTQKFKNWETFTVNDIINRTGCDRGAAYNAIETLMSLDAIVKSGKAHCGTKYVRANQMSAYMRKSWRSEDCGEKEYYKGMHFFGNEDTSWRGAL